MGLVNKQHKILITLFLKFEKKATFVDTLRKVLAWQPFHGSFQAMECLSWNMMSHA